MTPESFARWHHLRLSLVVSQIAPTILLITTIALLQFGLDQSALSVRVATAGILLASGILGAIVQFQSASEAEALAAAEHSDHAVRSSARWLWVIKYVTPTIFVVIYCALMVALFS
jgi:SNF family Na+-dependent transporter